ncbi:uncharacterized protein B0H18DRAFT_7337 [Fomitopsis serialis]|uniref:uncharacterized protein n=1 Tax=Fomitopsis serialis TaxID=139415 RepID=UPI0020078E59|nr:uncharacterized protein B0H18DRAFT_7337 [Neoantrodia serialis]KAH9938224.1 hypothetical protein B0H18DRAFT_7337 [Neoantrodia serialis]
MPFSGRCDDYTQTQLRCSTRYTITSRSMPIKCFFHNHSCLHISSTSFTPMGTAWSSPPACFDTDRYILFAGSLVPSKKANCRRWRQKVKKMIAMHAADAVLPVGWLEGAHTIISTTGKLCEIACERLGIVTSEMVPSRISKNCNFAHRLFIAIRLMTDVILIAPELSDAGDSRRALRRKLSRLTVELKAASAFKPRFQCSG